MRTKTSHIIFCSCSYGFCALFLWLNRTVIYPSNVYPYLVITLMVLFTTWVLIKEVFLSDKEVESSPKTTGGILRVCAMGILSLVYVIIINIFGFYTTSVTYLIVTFNLFRYDRDRSRRAVFMSLGTGFLIIILVYLMFRYVLKVPTPKGIFL